MVTGLLSLLETIFRLSSSDKSHKWVEAHTGFEPAVTCLEGRCVTTTRMRRIGHPKLTMSVTPWLQTLIGGKFNETKGVQQMEVMVCRNGWGSWI